LAKVRNFTGKPNGTQLIFQHQSHRLIELADRINVIGHE
jgi:hypothetical protein